MVNPAQRTSLSLACLASGRTSNDLKQVAFDCNTGNVSGKRVVTVPVVSCVQPKVLVRIDSEAKSV